jgi:hypothetical protein
LIHLLEVWFVEVWQFADEPRCGDFDFGVGSHFEERLGDSFLEVLTVGVSARKVEQGYGGEALYVVDIVFDEVVGLGNA